MCLYFSRKKLFLFRKNKLLLSKKKMKGGMHPVVFRQSFRYFHSYWNICRRREIMNRIQFFLYTKLIFEYLEKEWTKNNWDKIKLIWICTNIERGNELLNPINFVFCDNAYVNHAKNCFYIENCM